MTAQEHWFSTTHWSKVALAKEPTDAQGIAALEQLCCTYWYPLYAYLRRRGYPPGDAEDLTQELFARLLRDNSFAQVDRAKGKFRSFLLASLNHLLANEHARSQAIKRGSGRPIMALDRKAGEQRYQYQPTTDATPEKLYEREWALTLLDQAMRGLHGEWVAAGKAAQFEQLKCFLACDGEERSYPALATQWQTTANAVAATVYRLRQRYRELVREQIAHTVLGPEELEEELHHLFAVLRWNPGSAIHP